MLFLKPCRFLHISWHELRTASDGEAGGEVLIVMLSGMPFRNLSMYINVDIPAEMAAVISCLCKQDQHTNIPSHHTHQQTQFQSHN